MSNELNDADEQIGDLQDKLDHANQKLGDVLQNLLTIITNCRLNLSKTNESEI